MWPLKKRTRDAAPVLKLDAETICPICLERYPVGTIMRDYPYCPDCSSEGMDFDVETFSSYMARNTEADFDALLQHWDQAEGFRPEYKAAKRQRIVDLQALKAASL